MFKNFWYAVEFSTDLEVGKPKKVKILGQQLVLYRKNSDHSVVAMSDLCVHRGAALSGGTIKDDCIVCPYHGWEYDPDGVVQKIPAQPDKGIPRKARIDSYPTQEKYMFIWVYMGDLPEEERPPIPDWSDIDDTETYRAVTGSFLWKSNYERILENGIDVAHTPFVHGGVFGNPEKPEVPDFVMEDSDWHCKISIELNPPRSKGIWGMINPNRQKLTERPPVPVSTTWFMPNMILLDVGTPMGAMKIFDVNIPIDEETTLVKFVALRSFFKGKWADRDARRRVFKVLYEDQAIVDHVRPELLPFDLSAELHIKSDQNAVKYRRRRQELIEAGWGVEGNTIVGEGGARVEARVIPSPTRKAVPELASAWNFKEVRSREILDARGEASPPRVEHRLVLHDDLHDDSAPEADAIGDIAGDEITTTYVTTSNKEDNA
ncbi:aromatic ring-hydroxylating dioxygenase subunit alpha [Aeromicrobium wangtongii]|uniref:Aromatic ring-hydroxylating dioxygenase subunit alpha n=1 Tax=Aeromicrobium wangtongii TaxID=2969247 RepID=A0ABY5M666_9ACTN|nr:aromatic ring-hydroxylating dioxygenase subunit alpha [Aeromicrobium wangtongii]MCD9198620.1 aromatic ring-hydroxylating dioxygenase subunit alpha [Aeromicrobium wangtongii]UUP12646.1 aromatic ring-hydroxylating dioxygenase subunit alpha [Aeromicrobium wangtongii]